MKSIGDYIVDLQQLLLLMCLSTLLVKTVLYFSFEKYWDSLKFFHYSRIDLKMTTMRHLRTWRKRQNKMTTAMGVLFMLFAAVYMFHKMIVN